MAGEELLKPTLHVEVVLKGASLTPQVSKEVRAAVAARILDICEAVTVGQVISGFDDIGHEEHLGGVEVADYTGPVNVTGYYNVREVHLDVQTYHLKEGFEPELRRSIKQSSEDEVSQARILALPNVALHEEWNSLVFDDALPARLLRYLVRMASMMTQPGLNLSTFNWNRLCLLHGPPGSGKSTLCRALAQKLSIRLGDTFPKSILVEINANAMLSKYFGESGKLIGATFERIYIMAQDQGSLICVVIDEVETIAGSRERSTSGTECQDGVRATNQLLTALDRLRDLPNVIVLCTSNLIEAIDPAFCDRVDIKQLIPCPSPAAIYNIFRSCLNELVRSNLVDAATRRVSSHVMSNQVTSSSSTLSSSPHKPVTRSNKARVKAAPTTSSSPELWTMLSAPTIPTLSETTVRLGTQPSSPGWRIWVLAQKCEGFSGRALRRLPILGLAMYTWGGSCSLHDAVSALEAAVEQELMIAKSKHTNLDVASASDCNVSGMI